MEPEIFKYLIDDVNKATNLIVTADPFKNLDHICACEFLELSVGNLHIYGRQFNNAGVVDLNESWYNLIPRLRQFCEILRFSNSISHPGIRFKTRVKKNVAVKVYLERKMFE